MSSVKTLTNYSQMFIASAEQQHQIAQSIQQACREILSLIKQTDDLKHIIAENREHHDQEVLSLLAKMATLEHQLHEATESPDSEYHSATTPIKEATESPGKTLEPSNFTRDDWENVYKRKGSYWIKKELIKGDGTSDVLSEQQLQSLSEYLPNKKKKKNKKKKPVGEGGEKKKSGINIWANIPENKENIKKWCKEHLDDNRKPAAFMSGRSAIWNDISDEEKSRINQLE